MTNGTKALAGIALVAGGALAFLGGSSQATAETRAYDAGATLSAWDASATQAQPTTAYDAGSFQAKVTAAYDAGASLTTAYDAGATSSYRMDAGSMMLGR